MINRSGLSVSEVAALDQYELSKKHLATLETVVDSLKELCKKEAPDHAGVESLLKDVNSALKDLASKEVPETKFPNISGPIVSALSELKGVIKAIPAPQVDVKAPNVSVAAPDLKALEKGFASIPKAFEKAVAGIPKYDNSDLADRLDAMLERLADIDVGVRMKPQAPGTIKVTNPDGSNIAGGTGGSGSGLTNTELRASPVPVSGTVTVSNPTANPETGLAKALTQTDGTQKTQVTNFPATQPVSLATAPTTPVTGTFWQTTQPVSLASVPSHPVTGPLTDTQLRATAVPVSGTVSTGGLTDTQLRATAVPISGSVTANTGLTQPLTDTQLRATPVPVSGTVTANTGLTQPLTDTQIRATALPVSLASVPTHGVTGTFWQTTQPVSIASMPSTPVTGTFWQTTQPVSIAATVANKETQPATSSVTSVANSVTSVTLLASNVNRRVATIYNDDSAAVLSVKLGATASATSFTIKIQPGGYYELPRPVYTGVIDAIASAATGSARITELT